jgi:hypothetical protein
MASLAHETDKTGGSAELQAALQGLLDVLNAGSLRDRAAEIAFWQEKLAAINDPALDGIRENLTRLREALTADKPEDTAIGHALTLLGESVETFAEYYDGPACEQLDALGTRLRTEGIGLGGGMLSGSSAGI